MRPSRLLSTLLLSASLSQPLLAQDFATGVDAADQLAANQDWSGAHAALKAAMEQADDRREVLIRLPELQQRLADWTFEQRTGKITAQDLFTGKVKSFKEKSLQLKIVWDWANMTTSQRENDFMKVGNDWFFNTQLGNKLKLTLKGEFDGHDPVTLLGGYNLANNSGWRFVPGFKDKKKQRVVTMSCRRVGKTPERLAYSADGIEIHGGEWSYTLELTRGSFTLKRGNKKAGRWKTKHPELTKGYAGFFAPGLTSVELSASIDPERWAHKEAELQRALRDRFARGDYDASADIPDWLGEMQAKSALAKPLRAPKDSGSGWDQLLAPKQGFDVEDFIRNRSLNQQHADYARALYAYANGDLAAADKFCRQAAANGLDFGPLWDLHGRAKFATGGRTRALDLLRAHLNDWPDDCGRTLAWLSGRRAGPTAALKAYQEALAAGGVGVEIIRNRASLETALAGPIGQLSSRWTGKNIIVLSDSGSASAEIIGQWADSFITYLGRDFLEFQKPKGQIQLLHFGDEANLQAFRKRSGLSNDLLAINPLHMPMVAWDPSSATPPRTLYSTLFFHYAATSVELARIPRWVVYGLKGWFESGQMEVPSYVGVKNTVLYDRTKENEGGLYFTPRQLMLLPLSVWESDPDAFYWAEAEAYILMHFLILSDLPAYQGLFPLYLGAVASGRSSGGAFAGALRSVDMDKMNQDWLSFWKEQNGQ